jgi:hypothetical protein
MMINQGDTVFILEAAGSIVEGIYSGEKSEGMFGVLVGLDKTIFKRKLNIFADKKTAQAQWLVRRFKRMRYQGIPVDEIIFTEADKPALERAMELWPEDLI